MKSIIIFQNQMINKLKENFSKSYILEIEFLKNDLLNLEGYNQKLEHESLNKERKIQELLTNKTILEAEIKMHIYHYDKLKQFINNSIAIEFVVIIMSVVGFALHYFMNS